MLKEGQTSALAMAGAAGVIMMAVIKQQEASLAFVYAMVEERDAKRRDALKVQRVFQASAYLMGEVGVVSTLIVEKVLKEAQFFAKLMVEEEDVHLKGVPKVRKEVLLFARDMGVASDVCLEVGPVQRVSMGLLYSVLLMGVVNVALQRAAQRVPEGELIIV